jgi:hypothetical protein
MTEGFIALFDGPFSHSWRWQIEKLLVGPQPPVPARGEAV